MHTTSVIGYFRMLGMCLAVILGLGAFGELAYAVAVTTCPGGTCSLLDLFNGSTITINGTVFSDWAELETQSPTPGVPDYGAINVIPIDIPFNPGLRFEANDQWSISNGAALDQIFLEFSYVVDTLLGIIGTRLDLLPGGTNTGGKVDVFAQACGDVLCVDTASVNEVFAEVVNQSMTADLRDASTFAPHVQLFVFNTIQVDNDLDDGMVELLGFEQRLAQVPEPGTMTLLGFGLVGLLGYSWRRRMAGEPRAMDMRT